MAKSLVACLIALLSCICLALFLRPGVSAGQLAPVDSNIVPDAGVSTGQPAPAVSDTVPEGDDPGRTLVIGEGDNNNNEDVRDRTLVHGPGDIGTAPGGNDDYIWGRMAGRIQDVCNDYATAGHCDLQKGIHMFINCAIACRLQFSHIGLMDHYCKYEDSSVPDPKLVCYCCFRTRFGNHNN